MSVTLFVSTLEKPGALGAPGPVVTLVSLDQIPVASAFVPLIRNQ